MHLRAPAGGGPDGSGLFCESAGVSAAVFPFRGVSNTTAKNRLSTAFQEGKPYSQA